MEYCYCRDFLFCELCGTQLLLSSPNFAQCPHCRFRRPARGKMEGKEIRYTVSAEDIRRELNIESFVQTGTVIVQEELQRPIANKICPNCGHNELEYYTKQLRSADEGATTFYECRKCKQGFREQ